jgi:hypothetical protein
MQSTSCMGNEEDLAVDEREISIPKAVGQRAVKKLNKLSSFRSGGARGWIAPWTP